MTASISLVLLHMNAIGQRASPDTEVIVTRAKMISDFLTQAVTPVGLVVRESVTRGSSLVGRN